MKSSSGSHSCDTTIEICTSPAVTQRDVNVGKDGSLHSRWVKEQRQGLPNNTGVQRRDVPLYFPTANTLASIVKLGGGRQRHRPPAAVGELKLQPSLVALSRHQVSDRWDVRLRATEVESGKFHRINELEQDSHRKPHLLGKADPYPPMRAFT